MSINTKYLAEVEKNILSTSLSNFHSQESRISDFPQVPDLSEVLSPEFSHRHPKKITPESSGVSSPNFSAPDGNFEIS